MRGAGGFGSTGQLQVYFAMDITKGKPEKMVTLAARSGHKLMLKAVIDTGVDITTISATCQPPPWPTVFPQFGIAGIGGIQATRVSRDVIAFTFPDGVKVSTWPFMMFTPPELKGLIGDLLSQIRTTSFLVAATVGHPILKIKWKINKPVCIDWWPLTEQKLLKVEDLFAEQLLAGHIVPSTSAWNSFSQFC